MTPTTLKKYCPICEGTDMKYREGIAKTGKPYKAYFCQNKPCKGVVWVKDEEVDEVGAYKTPEAKSWTPPTFKGVSAPTAKPDWDAIQANKEEGMRYLNAKNGAATLLSACIKGGSMTLAQALEHYEAVTQTIYDIGAKD